MRTDGGESGGSGRGAKVHPRTAAVRASTRRASERVGGRRRTAGDAEAPPARRGRNAEEPRRAVGAARGDSREAAPTARTADAGARKRPRRAANASDAATADGDTRDLHNARDTRNTSNPQSRSNRSNLPDSPINSSNSSHPSNPSNLKPDPFSRLRQNVPQQARSRETLSRLLAAAEQLLDEGGIDAATVPAIAERAGVSVGVIYRRFPDKDALLRAVFERFFVRAREHNLHALSTIARVQMPLPLLMRRLIHGTIEGQRRMRHILRALIRYYRTHRDPTFRRAAMELNREAMKAISVVLLSTSAEMTHPNPEQAIEFAMLSLGAILYATILEEEPAYTLTNPAAIEEELVRMLFSYLGIKE